MVVLNGLILFAIEDKWSTFVCNVSKAPRILSVLNCLSNGL